MGEQSKIQWCHATFNPWEGCSHVSEGCRFCYAEAREDRFKTVQWGPSGTRRVTSEANWAKPLKWNRDEAIRGADYDRACRMSSGEYDIPDPFERPRVFCASLADVFEDWRGEMIDSGGNTLYWCPNCKSACWSRDGERCDGCLSLALLYTMSDVRRRLFDLVDATPNLDWLLLTKRPENVLKMLPPLQNSKVLGAYTAMEVMTRPNVWLGTSVENQAAADERIPHLLACPAAVRFLSVEPLLGPIDLSKWINAACDHCGGHGGDPELPGNHCGECFGRQAINAGIGWVIIGGESGRGARPCNVEWIRDLVKQCKAAGVPAFCKQLGANIRGLVDSKGLDHDKIANILGSTYRLRDPKGGNIEEWPHDLQVREFPNVR